MLLLSNLFLKCLKISNILGVRTPQSRDFPILPLSVDKFLNKKITEFLNYVLHMELGQGPQWDF